jgi:hypothetical protein
MVHDESWQVDVCPVHLQCNTAQNNQSQRSIQANVSTPIMRYDAHTHVLHATR